MWSMLSVQRVQGVQRSALWLDYRHGEQHQHLEKVDEDPHYFKHRAKVQQEQEYLFMQWFILAS